MVNILQALIDFIPSIFNIINLLITDLGIIFEIIINPYLLLTIVFALSFYYAILKSSSRKQLISNQFVFFKLFFIFIYKLGVAMIPFIIGVLSAITQLIQGVFANSYAGLILAGIAAVLISIYLIF